MNGKCGLGIYVAATRGKTRARMIKAITLLLLFLYHWHKTADNGSTKSSSINGVRRERTYEDYLILPFTQKCEEFCLTKQVLTK